MSCAVHISLCSTDTDTKALIIEFDFFSTSFSISLLLDACESLRPNDCLWWIEMKIVEKWKIHVIFTQNEFPTISAS